MLEFPKFKIEELEVEGEILHPCCNCIYYYEKNKQDSVLVPSALGGYVPKYYTSKRCVCTALPEEVFIDERDNICSLYDGDEECK